MYKETYHRFVKTTPKPSATKKSKGELVGPPPPELGTDDDAAGGGTALLEGTVVVVVAVEVAIIAAVWTAGGARFTKDRTWSVGRTCSYQIRIIMLC